jgi:hypothetical protein
MEVTNRYGCDFLRIRTKQLNAQIKPVKNNATEINNDFACKKEKITADRIITPQ